MKVIEFRNYDYLIKKNLGLVYKIVSRFFVNPFEKDDLVQAGLMGLFYAAQKFDNKKGFKFSTYATPYILGEIKKELEKMNIIRVNSYFKKIARKVNQTPEKDFQNLAVICQTSIENVAIATSYQSQVILLEPIELDRLSSKKSIFDRYLTNQSYFSALDNEIFRLRFFYQWNQKEIGYKLKLNQSNISRRLRQMIKLIIEDS